MIERKIFGWIKRACPDHAGHFNLECPKCNGKNSEPIYEPMKLTELEATFVARFNPADKSFWEQSEIGGAQGVMFVCPKCQGHSVLIWFKSPLNATMVPPDAFPKNEHRWEFSGTSIEDLSLFPSVDLSKGEHSPADCLWHGWVKNGTAE